MYYHWNCFVLGATTKGGRFMLRCVGRVLETRRIVIHSKKYDENTCILDQWIRLVVGKVGFTLVLGYRFLLS